jgi:dCTP diphosphatase
VFEFNEVYDAVDATGAVAAFRSPRHIAFNLQANVGELCKLFSQYPEKDCQTSINSWSAEDRLKFFDTLGNICLLLIILSKMCSLSIGKCLFDKFAKNDAKYPVNLSKGSSAKYTAYTATSSQQSTSQVASLISPTNVLSFIALTGLSFLLGRYTHQFRK